MIANRWILAMPSDDKSYLKFDHNEYAKTRAPDDFWGQVRRTVGGAPVSEEQIGMIVDRIRSALELQAGDALLDIACGNGALSHLLFESCTEYLGVDLSGHLVSVAKANFEALPHYEFIQQDAVEYLRSESKPQRFSKVLCYGSFSYFAADAARQMLRILFAEFTSVQRVFIGNLPDRDRAEAFYDKPLNPEELADCSSQIGIWRTRDEFSRMARDIGWRITISSMPDTFYASHYRYDALLSR